MCVHCYKLLLHKPTIALLWSGLYHIHQLGKEIVRLLNACPTVLDEKNTNILSVITFSDISKAWASWRLFEGSMWVTCGPYTIEGWNILLVFQKKNQNCYKNMKNLNIWKYVNFIFSKFMTLWKIFHQNCPNFSQ